MCKEKLKLSSDYPIDTIVKNWIEESVDSCDESPVMEFEFDGMNVTIEGPGDSASLADDSADIQGSHSWDIVVTVNGESDAVDMRSGLLCLGFQTYLSTEYLAAVVEEKVLGLLEAVKAA